MTPVAACRFADRCELDTFEAAVECLGSHSEKTRTEIARLVQQQTGKSEGYLRSALSPHDGTHNLQLALGPALTNASGNNALLKWFARACGYGIYRLPPQETTSRSEILPAYLDTVVAHTDLARAMREALVDRKLTAAERVDITRGAQGTIAELFELIAVVCLEADPPRG